MDLFPYLISRNRETSTVTGTEIDLTDAFDTRPRYLGINATETKQETTTGKNLLQVNSATRTLSNYYYQDIATGILIEQNMVGTFLSFSFNINISSLTTTSSNIRAVLGYGTIASIMSTSIKQAEYPNVAVGKYSIKIENCEITNDMVGKYIVLRYLGFRTQSSATYTYSNAQLEFNKNATDFEPYTGGQPSPNPDYPQDVETMTNLVLDIEDKNDINTKGIRLGLYQIADGNYASPSSGNRYSTLNDLLKVEPNTTYTVTTLNNINAQFYQLQYNANKVYTSNSSSETSVKSYTFTTSSTTHYIAIDVRAYDSTNYNIDYVGGIQIYNISNNKQYPISLANQELLNKGNYVDKIIVDESTGQSYIEKRWRKYIFDGEETFSEAELSETVYRFICNISDLNSVPYIYGGEDGYCNYYKYLMKYSGDLSNQRIYTQGNSIVIVTSVATQKDNFKIWLKDKYDSGTPVEVYYPLATPQLIPIDNPSIKLLNGVNHITNSEGAEMTITYVKSIGDLFNKCKYVVLEDDESTNKCKKKRRC